MKHEATFSTPIVLSLMMVTVLSSEHVYADDDPSSSLRTSENPMKLAQQDVNAICLFGKEIDTFATAEFPRSLVSLRLYKCAIRDVNSIRLLSRLRELHMQGCGLANIAFLNCLNELSYLSLADNEITDIASLSNCRALAWLDLRHNRILSISPLQVLTELAYLDIRGNPVGDTPKENLIGIIAERNPDVVVMSGPDPDPNDVREDSLRELLTAKARIANFALTAEWRFHDEYPNLPLLSDEIRHDLLLLRRAGGREYLADVAILLMRYATYILATTHTGTLLNGENPLVAEFLTTVPRRELGGDEITTGAIAHWVSIHRNKIPRSAVLDVYIDRYRRVETALEQEWKEIRSK
jgi:hypothetical protein